MSDAGAADEWDFVVPDNGDELVAELRRHGVRPGERLHVRSASTGKLRSKNAGSGKWRSAATVVGKFTVGGKASRCEPSGGGPEAAEPDYIGSFDSGQSDLAKRSEEILREHFPDR